MIYCVVPTVRPDRLAEFRAAWAELFRRHGVRLVVVHDGDEPRLEAGGCSEPAIDLVAPEHRDLFFNRTDAVRNYGFVYAARMPDCEYVLTLDDDVAPPPGRDPIAEHLSVLGSWVPLTWMNTCPAPPGPYLRGVPYAVRTEAMVVLSHGVWENVPDFDAPTQIQFGDRVPTDLPYHVGPVPKGVLFPLCGMNVMVSREALPWFYFAPMGPGAFGLNRFADIWLGIALKPAFDRRGWACYTGASKVVHTRASDVYKNLAQEAEGLRLNEAAAFDIHAERAGAHPYFALYADRRRRYESLVRSILEPSRG